MSDNAAADGEVIAQAQGALMAIYGINADTAFDLLISRSEETGIGLRALAEELFTALHNSGPTTTPAPASHTYYSPHTTHLIGHRCGGSAVEESFDSPTPSSSKRYHQRSSAIAVFRNRVE